MVCLQQFCSVMLDDQGSSHGLDVHHSLEMRSATGADGAVPSGISLVVLFRKVEQPIVKCTSPAASGKEASWVKIIVFSEPNGLLLGVRCRNDFVLRPNQKLAGVQVQKLFFIGTDRGHVIGRLEHPRDASSIVEP